MQLTFTPNGGSTVDLAALGEVSIQSVQTQSMGGGEIGNKEGVTLTIKIESWQDTYASNYENMKQAKDSLAIKGGVLLWKDDDGTAYLDPDTGNGQFVTVVSDDLPESPNAWGAYQQALTVVFKYERSVVDTAGGTHIGATFTTTGDPLVLGQVDGFKDSYHSARWNEFRKFRSRLGGMVSMSGCFLADKALDLDARRAYLEGAKTKMDAILAGPTAANEATPEGTLVYSTPGTTMFSQAIRVDSWNCEIDQAVFCLKWSLEGSYTKFPDESGYAAADYGVQSAEDRESGETTLTLSGRVMAASRSLAVAKIGTIRTAALAYYGFSTANLLRNNGLDEKRIDVDDMVAADRDMSQDTRAGGGFIELGFNETYRKKSATVISFTFGISSTETATTGLIMTSYAGSVTAGGSTYLVAYATALAKAQSLGDNKFPFKLSSKISQAYRQVGTDGPQELVRLDFSYDYQIKGTRLWLEVTTSGETNLFDDDKESASGFVVAQDAATALSQYNTLVKVGLYNGRVILNEHSSNHTVNIGTTGNNSVAMWTRLEFSITLRKLKSTGFLAIRYGVSIESDPVSRLRTTQVQGRVLTDPAAMAAIEAGTGGNALDAFLSGFTYGVMTRSSRSFQHEKSAQGDQLVVIEFANSYQSILTAAQTILESSISEEITFSNKRYITHGVPDGYSVIQQLGYEPGSRTISGSVTSPTEAAAAGFVKLAHALAFPSNTMTGGGAAPTTRYQQAPRISTAWVTLPLTSIVARGSSTNFRVCTKSFSFSEILPQYNYAEV